MAEHSGFFNAHLVDGAYDRIYHAEDFAKYFSSLASNGVFSKKLNELMVYQDAVANMNIRVLSGYAFINGYHYENDDELLLTVDVADGILNRIDSVVVRWSTSDRAIRIAIKKGTAAANALPPPLQRDADIYELKLADINVKAGTTSILQANIIDTRLDTDVCGIVSFAGEGNSAQLISDVTKLKNIFIESTQYPGCYYRVVDNEVEWINPPNITGIEYRLTERKEGKPVYILTNYVATLPKVAGYVTVSMVRDGEEEELAADDFVSIEAKIKRKTEDAIYFLPHVDETGIPLAYLMRARAEISLFSIGVTQDMSNYEAYIITKYTKP